MIHVTLCMSDFKLIAHCDMDYVDSSTMQLNNYVIWLYYYQLCYELNSLTSACTNVEITDRRSGFS